MRHAIPAVMFVALGACAMPRVPHVAARQAGPDRAAVARAIGQAAQQVQRCYRAPRVGGSAKRIGTVMLVRFAPDGTLIGLPELVQQTGITPDNAGLAPAMAEAARVAIIRCTPVSLPAELYENGWNEFQLTFSLRMAA